MLPEIGFPGCCWNVDPKRAQTLITWGRKRGSKPAPTPGTKTTGVGMREAFEPLEQSKAKEAASAGGTALYLSADRPDTMYASKTLMQHVSRPNGLMEARLSRLARYYGGQPELLWCFELQDDPCTLRCDGDADWAPTTDVHRRSTSGGVVRYGGHLWDAFSVSQAVNALSSGESEFYATGSVMARGLLAKHFMEETGRTVKLEVGSDSTVGRGICQRHGVGKVRHLENKYIWLQEVLKRKHATIVKVGTLDMVADMLTKYVEAEAIKKHCASLNLRFTSVVVGALLVKAVRAEDTQDEQLNSQAVVLTIVLLAGIGLMTLLWLAAVLLQR